MTEANHDHHKPQNIMKFKLAWKAGLIFATLALLGSCAAPRGLPVASTSEPQPTAPTRKSGSLTPPRSDTTTTPAGPTIDNTTPSSIPAGSVALFATISGGTKSEFLRQEGGSISWDSTHYEFVRYLPDAHLLDEFGWTTSESYAKSYIYGFTTGQWVYTVRHSSDTDSNDITRLDPRTGAVKGRFPSIVVTGDWEFGFTVLGDRLIYRTKIYEDLFGKRRSGGDVMSVEMGGKPVKLLDYGDANNIGHYYAIGDNLISIVTRYDGNLDIYDIYRVDPPSMAIGDLVFSYVSKKPVRFFEGETALYWSETDPATGDVKVIRFPMSAQPSYYMTISENNPDLVSVDESQGKVLIVFTDETPESPFYYLADLATGDLVDLNIDGAFLRGLNHGDGQFCILD